MKALALFSGGLDSLLAIRTVQLAGVDVEAVHFLFPFLTEYHRIEEHKRRIAESAAQLAIKLHFVNLGDDYLRIIEQPKFGYGKNLNPCIDCRIFLLLKARELMDHIGASFLVTGEVLGQRPKSQHESAFNIAERETGMRGLILRPLSAHRLKPTLPEERGWIDRGKLLGIVGRGRDTQMALAERWEIKYPAPAGGCLLTMQEYSKRLKELMEDTGRLEMGAVSLLRFGRHFRLGKGVKAIVGRDSRENLALMWAFRRIINGSALMKVDGPPGPLTLVIGDHDGDKLETAARITARYADSPQGLPVNVKGLRKGKERFALEGILPMSPGDIEEYRI